MPRGQPGATSSGLLSQRHHHSARCYQGVDQPRRRGQRHHARPGSAAAGGQYRDEPVHQCRRPEPRGQNLYVETASSGQPQQGTPGTNGLGTIQQGYLEASNVNVVQSLVTMIQTQRAYEMNSKAIRTSDQMLPSWHSSD